MSDTSFVDAADAGGQVGLHTAHGAVPLAGVSIDAVLEGPCLQVAVRQRYRNAEAVPVEAVYVFPLPEDAAVCGFRARFGDERVDGRVQPRDEAFATYDDALLEGRMAALLDQERPNVFTASLGNLPPGAEAVMEIRYVARLRPEGDAYRLTFPTTVSPRYVPAQPPEIGEPDGDRVNPERWLAVPYGLQFNLRVRLWGQGGLRSVESPSHPVRVTLGEQGDGAAGAEVTLAQDAVALDRDLVVLVQPKAGPAPLALAVPSPDGGETVLLEFMPDLPQVDDVPREVVFLLDCSGSMDGTSIEAAKRALQLCVRALRLGDTFDIVRFGSTHEGLWPTSVPFDDTTLAQASAWIEATDANLGGTEILSPLRYILQRHVSAGRPRTVLLLTDGQVSNEAEVLELATQHARSTSIFAFGIGAGASDHLVRGIARAGRGEAEVIFPGERIEPKVLRTFARLRTPRLPQVLLETGSGAVQLAPRDLPPLFAGLPFSVLARYPARAPAQLVLAAGEHRWEVPVRRAEGVPAEGAGIAAIALCWARERIRDLEAPRRTGSRQQRQGVEAGAHAELVAIGEAYGLLSSETSYVAVSSRVLAAGQDAELRRVPVALTAGWGGAPAVSLFVADRSMPPAASMSRVNAYASPRLRTFLEEDVFCDLFGTSLGRANSEQPIVAEQDEWRSERASIEAPWGSLADASDGEHALMLRMNRLLLTQRADGLFPWSPALERELGRLAGQLAPRRHDLHVVTVVVVELLRRRFAAFPDETRLAIEKATLALGADQETAARARCAALLSAL